MPYVAPDGTIHEQAPWGISRLVNIFWGAIAFVKMFFQTLIPGLAELTDGSRNSRSGGPGGPGSGPGTGPRRRFGGVTTLSDCSIPGGG